MPEARHPVPNEDALLAHRPWVRALARAVASDASAADDLEQETLVRALDSPPPRGLTRAWLGTVLRNLSRRAHRTRGRAARRERGAAVPEGVESAAEVVARAESHRRLVSAVMALPEPGRSTVLLRYYEGLSPGEVAARTGVPVETARTRLKRALASLRECLESEGGGAGGMLALAPLLGGTRSMPPAAAGGAWMGSAAKVLLAAAAAAAIGVGGLALLGGEGGGEPAASVAAAPKAPPQAPGALLVERSASAPSPKPTAPAVDPEPPPDPGPPPAPDTATLLLDHVAWGRITVDQGLRELARRAGRDLAYEDDSLRRLCETTPLAGLEIRRVGWEECMALVERTTWTIAWREEGRLLAHEVEPRRVVMRLVDPGPEEAPEEDPRVEAVRKRLREERTSFAFTGQALTEAFAYLSARHRLNIVVDERTARKRCDEMRVHLTLTDVPLEEALAKLLELDPELRREVRGNSILVR